MSLKTVSLMVLLTFDSLSKCHSQRNQAGTLIMAHAIFRHGDRTAITKYCYPTDPYKNEKYLPFGPGELTNKGKQREYRLGKRLRQRYNQLIGDLYTPGLIYARSSGASRTQMSLLLVLASLFPPREKAIWNKFVYWQPIPYQTVPLKSDKLLGGFESCPNFQIQFRNVLNSDQIQKLNEKYSELFKYISENAGYDTIDIQMAVFLYSTLKSEAEYGFKLPKWTNKVYPTVLKKVAGIGYSLFSATTSLKQIGAGLLLEKIINDTQSKIRGHIDTKLFLYSGHDYNVAAVLNTLKVFKPHDPPYGSCVLIEVHRIDGQYGMKVFYENNEGVQTGLLTIPGCGEFCPLDKFISLVEKYFPDQNVCGS